MNLRVATKSDIDDIMKIEQESFEKEIQESKEIFLARISTRKNCVILAQINGKTIGYISVEFYKDLDYTESSFLIGHNPPENQNEDCNILYISSFALLKKYRGYGNGKEFLCATLDLFQNQNKISRVVLLVNKKWLVAIKIYESCGFETCKVFKNFFYGSDGFLMEKDC